MPPKPKLSRDCAKEVQRAVAFSLMEEVYNSKGMTNADKEKKMYHDYHGFADDGTNGDENIVGYLDQLLEGTNQFSGLYDREDLEINDASNEERARASALC